MKPFLAALRFLTVVPIPGTWGTAEQDLARSVPWFPVVGLLIGGVAALVASGLAPVAPPMVTAVLLIGVLLGCSGCLHLDGLADTADGMLSCRSRERVLEIMKDSRTGAMGAMALVMVLLAKFAALASLPPALVWPAVLLMPLAGRSMIVVHLALLPYAREGGTGAVFYQQRPRLAAVWAAVALLAVAWGVLGLRGLATGGVCLAITLVLAVYLKRKIGGVTGDTLGALCEIVELIPPLCLAFGPLGVK
jgi:adenosylcobinamide-GDP ribazoletransferase